MTTLRTGRDLAADIRVRSLLSAAVGGGEARLDAVMRRYRDDPATALLVAFRESEPIGVAGYERCADRIVLLHIATSSRGRGVGRRLVARIRADDPTVPIVAETDRSALGFYVALGFGVTSLGEKYPDVERFRVRLNSGDDSD
ncbi:ribosomal protein S18 acetylase RimI-like enzyme [Nocardia kruczakiae]|uniref:Ribosomal protein S18 acetylase RimI-like enzyme n=1 Tax=Nocardia kruczakiae TaxID=261477 RepID=A0ABU1XDI3_9NOCA|nr:GNAT family N-acetyltransferase [Nocardia kruczakiae]MDR7168591.1 ribosomal protein S18 acetylase RimI-like enzyme [Nocardia kruczakiae]